MKQRTFLRLAAVMIVVFTCAVIGSAQTSGYDLFQTGSGASVDLSSMGLGVVNLQGMPLTVPNNNVGNTDTIMYRPNDFPSGGGTVSVTVWALQMKSVSPVTFSGQSADVWVTINNSGGAISSSSLPQPDALSPSTGTITNYPSSGTFDSSITVNADVIFVKAGGSPSDSTAVLGSGAAPAITLSQTGSSYSSTAPAGYPIQSSPTTGFAAATTTATSVSLGSGGFYPRPVHRGPHPVVPATQPVSKCLTPLTPTASATAAPSGKQGASGAKAQSGTSGAATIQQQICYE